MGFLKDITNPKKKRINGNYKERTSQYKKRNNGSMPLQS